MREDFEYVNCNLCGLRQNKFLFSKGTSNYIRCKNCGLVYKNPRLPEKAELEKYIYDEICQAHRYEVQKSKIELYLHSLKMFTGYKCNGKLLDVGCGGGFFLKMARESGWQVFGVEVSKWASNFARDNYKLDVYEGTLKDANFPSDYFDIVTLWEVLDHFTDPKKELLEIRRILRPGGLIFFRVRNYACHRFAVHSMGVLHLYGFTANTAKKLLRITGFKDILIRNSKLTLGDPFSVAKKLNCNFGLFILIKKIIFYMAEIIFYLTAGRFVLGPSIIVFAKK